MKKPLLFIVFAFGLLLNTSYAQVQFEQDTVIVNFEELEDDIVAHGFVTNLAPQVKNYRWILTENTMPSGWESAVCDKNNCYLPTVDSMAFDLGPAEKGTMDVHVYPEGNAGTTASLSILVKDLNNPDLDITGHYLFSAVLVGNNEVEFSAIKVFPNPTNNGLNIQGMKSGQLTQLELYSLDGRLLHQRDFRESTHLSMTDLPNTLYLLKLRVPENGAVFQQLVQKID